MKIELPDNGRIGAEIREVDGRELGPEEANRILDLVYEHKLVVFRDQHLSAPEYIAFARGFGTPQIYFQPHYHHPEHPEIFVSSNVKVDGRKVGVAGTGRYWHTDYQFFEEPLPLTMLSPQRLPATHRETYYIDMQRVYETLPEPLREWADDARGIHEAKWRYKVQPSDVDKSIAELLDEFGAITPAVTHPAVIEHPVTRTKSLYVSEGFTVGFEGLSTEEGKAKLRDLVDFTQQEKHVHRHEWRDGDILLWDNRPLIHKASTVPAGQPSVSYRIGVYDGKPFYVDGEPRIAESRA